MKTFKVTFFQGMEIFKVETFHNVIDQCALCERVASQIVCLELDPLVKCEAEGIDYTRAMNGILKYDIAYIDPEYARNWYNDL